MLKIELKVEGMHCGMCEAHVNDAVRKAAPEAKEVKSSAAQGTTSFLAETDRSQTVKEAIEELGYRVTDVAVAEYEKKGFFAKLFKK